MIGMRRGAPSDALPALPAGLARCSDPLGRALAGIRIQVFGGKSQEVPRITTYINADFLGKRAVTYQRPNKRLRWTLFLGFLALVYVGAFSVHEPVTAKGDKLALTTEASRKLARLPVGVEEDI